MDLQHLTVTSVEELLTEVLRIGRELPDQHMLWYRGLANSEYSLIPSLLRGAPDEDSVFDRERRLLTRFRQRSLPYWPSGYPQDHWEHLFAMQHHGVPTRLLDWSENFFVALYFASVGKSVTKPDGTPVTPTLWCLDPVGWNRGAPHLKDYEEEISVLTTADAELDAYQPETSRERLRKRLKVPVALYGTHNTQRIVAQRGTFTVAGRSLLPLESFATEISTETPTLWKIDLPIETHELRRSLATLGYTESMIFPDLPGLSRELDISEGWRK